MLQLPSQPPHNLLPRVLHTYFSPSNCPSLKKRRRKKEKSPPSSTTSNAVSSPLAPPASKLFWTGREGPYTIVQRTTPPALRPGFLHPPPSKKKAQSPSACDFSTTTTSPGLDQRFPPSPSLLSRRPTTTCTTAFFACPSPSPTFSTHRHRRLTVTDIIRGLQTFPLNHTPPSQPCSQLNPPLFRFLRDAPSPSYITRSTASLTDFCGHLDASLSNNLTTTRHSTLDSRYSTLDLFVFCSIHSRFARHFGSAAPFLLLSPCAARRLLVLCWTAYRRLVAQTIACFFGPPCEPLGISQLVDGYPLRCQ